MHGHDQSGWRGLLTGANAPRTVVLCGGAGLHALNLYIAATIMPDVVNDIGGLAYFAWCTSLFVTSSIVGAASTGSLLARLGPRRGYALGALLLALGSAVCAAAPHIAVLLAGRIVQGLGGGLLLSLPYAMIRVVFPAALWTRAVAVVSGAWGVATLLGPVAGGLLADLGIWRAAFVVLVPLAIVFAGLAYAVLPAGAPSAAVGVFPHAQLALLAAAVLVMSGASVLPGWFMQALALLAGGLLLAWLVRLDGRAAGGLLPRGALRRGHPLAASYLSMALLAVMVTCGEAMAPLFLQAIHGLGALGAGAMAALMSVGWSGRGHRIGCRPGTSRQAAERGALAGRAGDGDVDARVAGWRTRRTAVAGDRPRDDPGGAERRRRVAASCCACDRAGRAGRGGSRRRGRYDGPVDRHRDRLCLRRPRAEPGGRGRGGRGRPCGPLAVRPVGPRAAGVHRGAPRRRRQAAARAASMSQRQARVSSAAGVSPFSTASNSWRRARDPPAAY